MPPTASPFSMLGMLMGRSASLRKRNSQLETRTQSQTNLRKDEGALESRRGSKEDMVVVRKEMATPVESGSDTEESVTGDHMYSVVEHPLSTSNMGHENEWTNVPTQLDTARSSTVDTGTGSKATTVYETDHTSSSSVESLEKQELQDEIHRQVDRLEAKGEELRASEKAKTDAEGRLREVLAKLEVTERLNSESRKENKHQVDEVRRLGEALRAAEEEKEEKLARLASNSKAQLDSVLQRNRTLADENQRKLSENRKLEKRLLELEGTQLEMTKRSQDAERRIRELEDQNRRHLEERQVIEKQLRGLQDGNLKTSNRLKATVDELNSIAAQNEELKKQHSRQGEELKAREKELASLKNNVLAGSAKTTSAGQLEVLERQNRMLRDQIRRQSSELQSMMSQSLPRPGQNSQQLERPLKGDTTGGVVGILDALNSEIFQTAAFIADSLNFTKNATLGQKSKNTIQRATQAIGRPMVLILESRLAQADAEFNPLPIQIAVQACLVHCCMKVITSWYPGHWEYADFLSTIHSRIQGTAGQHAAAKWRTLTQSQLKSPSDGHLEAELKAFVTEHLIDTLNVAGWHEASSQAGGTLATFDERLFMIVKLALRLNTTVGEGWEAVVVQPEEIFDTKTMEDVYDEEETDGTDHVICTTEIGLSTTTGSSVKPKVVLQSMLEEETGCQIEL